MSKIFFARTPIFLRKIFLRVEYQFFAHFIRCIFFQNKQTCGSILPFFGGDIVW